MTQFSPRNHTRKISIIHFNNLKRKVDDSDIDKLKTVPVDFNISCHVVIKEVVKNTKLNKLNRKVNNLQKKFLTCLIYFTMC